jgi:hypothetical protein
VIFHAAVVFAALGIAPSAAAPGAPQDDALRPYAVHIDRTPKQPWPGYGVYLGNGLFLTAAHVVGSFEHDKPQVEISGRLYPTGLVRQGSLDGVDLTLLSVDSSELPVRMQMRRMPLCAAAPSPGEVIVVATPEGVARSRILPPAAIPADLRGRFGDALIGDVASTGNSGSGVFDAFNQCLLGIMSRKISVGTARLGLPGRQVDIAKYFVPVGDIKAFIPKNVSF